MPDERLTADELSRALLARQYLLERTPAPFHDVASHLVGLQAQNAWSPYLALASRVRGFTHAQLGDALVGRSVARIAVMRGTIHLVTADDALLLPVLTAPIFTRDLLVNAQHGAPLRTVDVAQVTAAARALVDAEPRVTTALGALLAERWPDVPPGTLAYAARGTLPLVQVPPRGVWGRSGATTWTTAWHWLGSPAPDLSDPDAHAAALEDLVLRYLAAFGPASVADAQAWSGLTGLRAVADRLGDRVVRLVAEPSPGKVRPREMLDLPEAPRPPGDTPAPVRFLPDFDNVLLGHADRTRLISDERRRSLQSSNGVLPGTFLLDGRVGGTWRIDRSVRGRATIVVAPFAAMSRGAVDAVSAEAEGVVRFVADEAAEHHVRVDQPAVASS
ncbi:winged helix DNA-binding domain-containing protein [Cellulomonas rhizosphaerae]|uniref:Winged helix DNA-binding domain-containing protein n=1 Tax=Cellulomonas rhizosphaerae TaxID=2293719 RepID=A0A413RKB0_9CELL|nr:winged helix DNA-binding domain-containing protein [Cellulomonas rhizosphaerae]RHA39370.1 winged helix DNA-binding domain-containing protein [Cellulomonas rhizosphaerae]